MSMSMNDWERDHEARWERHFDDASHDSPPDETFVRMNKVADEIDENLNDIDENLNIIEKRVEAGWTLQWIPPEDPLAQACERIRQLLLVIDHADREHDGQLIDHQGEVENARRFLKSLSDAVVAQ